MRKVLSVQTFVRTRVNGASNYCSFGSIEVFGKLPNYPSAKLTLTLTSHVGQNDGLGEG